MFHTVKIFSIVLNKNRKCTFKTKYKRHVIKVYRKSLIFVFNFVLNNIGISYMMVLLISACHDCDKIFSNPDSLRSHQNIFHKGLPRKVYLYVCEKCGRQFKQRMMLKHHEENNCGTGPLFQCQVCLKQFSSIHTRR